MRTKRTNRSPGRSSGRPRTRSTASAGWTALTGTPGTGKSGTGRRLVGFEIVEVARLAGRLGAARRINRGRVEVDLDRLGPAFRRYQRTHPAGIVVGHLAHLLPVSYAIVLRCHPHELARRLRGARRPARAIAENVLAEALDVVLIEALRRGLPVYEVDTTRRSPTEVARTVQRLVERRPSPHYGEVRWLADPRVTAQLLRGRA